MKFICKPCNYETDDQSNLNRHNKSKKHLDKSNKMATNILKINLGQPIVNLGQPKKEEISQTTKKKCDGCGDLFSCKQSLSRHRKICKEIITSDSEKEKDKQIAELKAQVQLEKQRKQTEILQLKLKFSEDKIKLLEKNNSSLTINNKTLSTVAENNSKTSCSAMNFVMKNFKNAPCIQKFDQYQLLLEGNEDYTIAEVVLNKYEKKELISFIGDVLIKKYKTENPHDRSMWSSDITRLAYMIRELTADNEPGWFHDKGGVKIANYTVKPIIVHIKDDLKRYIKESTQTLTNTEYDDLNNTDSDELRKKILMATEILQLIAKSEFSKDVIKYISGHFFLDRKIEQKQLTFEPDE
jgi:hypothetical protein